MKILTPPINFFLRTFALTGIPFAVIMSINNYFDNAPFDIGQFLFYLFLFGGLMATTFLAIQMANLKKEAGIPYNKYDFKVNQDVTLDYSYGLSPLFEKLLETGKFAIVQFNSTNQEIQIKTRMSAFSWGDNIMIKKLSDNKIRITTKNLLRTTLVDFGSSKNHIEFIKKQINTIYDNLHLDNTSV